MLLIDTLIEYIYMNQVILGILLGACLFVPWGQRRDHFAVRLVAATTLVLVAGQLVCGSEALAMAKLLSYAALVFLWVWASFACSAVHAVFSLTCAYAIQHITSKLVYMPATYLLINHKDFIIQFWDPAVTGLLAIVNAVVCIPIYLWFTRRSLRGGQLMFDSVRTVVFSALFLVAAVALSWVLENNLSMEAPTYLQSYFSLNAFCILFAATVLSLELTNCTVKRLENENSVLERLLENDRLQYEQARRDMDKINIRYHDLKQQYAHALAGEREELEAEMNAISPRYLTGNKALDVVLTQKAAACEEAGIQLVCSVDGEALEGMRSYHVYSLFGNALDNAAECLAAVDDASRRVIRVYVGRSAGMVVVRVENYTPAAPHVENGTLVTTKADAASHGYGVKSIRNIAESYGGTAEFFVEENVFCLVVALPAMAS